MIVHIDRENKHWITEMNIRRREMVFETLNVQGRMFDIYDKQYAYVLLSRKIVTKITISIVRLNNIWRTLVLCYSYKLSMNVSNINKLIIIEKWTIENVCDTIARTAVAVVRVSFSIFNVIGHTFSLFIRITFCYSLRSHFFFFCWSLSFSAFGVFHATIRTVHCVHRFMTF